MRRKRSEVRQSRQGQPGFSNPRENSGDSARPRYINAYWQGSTVVLIEPGGKVRRKKADHCCFIRTNKYTRALSREMRRSAFVTGITREDDWVRIRFTDRDSCRKACKWLEKERDIETFEGDISPVVRYMADVHALVVQPRACYIDIETDSRVPFSRKEEMRILVWCVVDAETGAVKKGVLSANTHEAERELLTEMWDVLRQYEQVIAWNGSRFDFPVIKARSEARGCTFVWRRYLWLDHLELFRRMNMMAAESGDEKQSFRLQDIAMAVLGEGKDDFDASKTWEAWADGDERLVPYCVKDTDLMRRVEEKTGYIALLQTLCEATGAFPDSRGVNPMVQVESFLLRLGIERGERFRTKHDRGDEHEKFKGAFVMDPTEKGIVKNVHVGDFSGLYPNIILTWNMSPETKRSRPQHPSEYMPMYLRNSGAWKKAAAESNESPPGCAEAAFTGVMFKQPEPGGERGILAAAVAELIRLRKYWNDKKASLPPGSVEWRDADRRSTAYKIAGNSFFGVVGSVMSRFFDREVAESVTQCGSWLIQETIKAAESKWGLRVIYGDTDSLFVIGCSARQFKEFVAWCNTDLYPDMIKAFGCASNHINLAYEKEFERVVFVTAKRYCGRYAHFKGTKAKPNDPKAVEVKGLEYKRGDSSKLARTLQMKVVDLLMAGHEDPKDFVPLVEEFQNKCLKGDLSLTDVVISKRLSRPIKGYVVRKKKDGTDSAGLPHVRIARILKERGRDVGEGAKIAYVCVDGSARPKSYIPAEDWADECDRHEVWEAQTWPPSERLLLAAFPDYQWRPWGRTRPRVRGRRAPPPGVQGDLF